MNLKLNKTLTGHTAAVKCLAIFADNTRLASGSDDKTIKLWQINTGELIRTLTGNTYSISCLAILPDNLLASGEFYQILVKIWNPDTGELIRKLSYYGNNLFSLALLPETNFLVAGIQSYDETILIWNYLEGQIVKKLTGHKSYTRSITCLPNGLIATGAGDRDKADTGSIYISEINDGKLIASLDKKKYHTYVYALASLSDNLIASGSWNIYIWDLATGDLVRRIETNAYSFSLAPLSNSMLASGIKKQIQIYDTNTGELITKLSDHEGNVCSLAVLPDDSLASGSEDSTIKIWTS
jgi:WD40 repeat protein